MRQRELSDQSDMKKLLEHMVDHEIELDMLLAGVHGHMTPWEDPK